MRILGGMGVLFALGACRETPRAPARADSTTATAQAQPVAPPPAVTDLHGALAEFRTVDGAITTVKAEDSLAVGDRLMLMVLHALGPGGWRDERHGVFVIDRTTDRPVLRLDLLDSLRHLDYLLRIESADSTSAVVCGAGATYGDGPMRIRYRYDLRTMRLQARRFAPLLTVLDFVAWRDTMYVLVAPQPVYAPPATVAFVRVPLAAFGRGSTSPAAIDSIPASALLPVTGIDSTSGRLALHGDSGDIVYHQDRWQFEPATAAPDSAAALELPFLDRRAPPGKVRRFLVFPDRGFVARPQYLLWDNTLPVNGARSDLGLGVYRVDTKGHHFLRFQASDYSTFARYRPQRVRDGYSRDRAELDEEIGPFTVVNGAVWFGTTFYDGEGHTGVGALTSFATGADTYHTWHPQALVDWSTSAILVEGDAVWLGLVSRSEGSESSGGLLEFRRSTEATTVYPLPDVIHRIRRVGSALLLGTSNGLYGLDRSRLGHLVLELDDAGHGLVARRATTDSMRRCP